MALPGNDDEVVIRIILDVKQANAAMKSLTESLSSTFNSINISTAKLQKSIQSISSTTGEAAKVIGDRFKTLYATQVDNANVSQQLGMNLKNAFNNQVNQAVRNIEQSMKRGSGAANDYARSIDAARIALGAIVAMVVFRTINFIEESMRKAIETAKEFETSLYRLANVERILSQSGIEVSMEGLRKGIQDIKKELPIFSEADISQQVSLIGIMTKDLGVTEQQIIDIAKAIGILNVRSGETEDLLTTTNKVLTAMVAPSGRGIASLGLDFGEANIEATAFANGILKAGESFKDLTDNEKDMLKIAILLESTGQELETIQDFLETNTGALAEQSAEWEDTLRTAGQALISLQAAASPFIIGFLNFLQDGINGTKAFVVILQAAKNSFIAFVGILRSFFSNPVEFIKNFESIGQTISDVFSASLEDGFDKFFSGVIPEDAPEWFKKLFGEFADEVDTGTESVDNLGDAITELPGFDDLIDDIGKLQEKLKDLQFEFDLETARDLEDFLIDMRRMLEDFARKRQDIVDDANKKIDDANRKHRNDEIDDEARFQEQMRQLREKFLFNLEDALRERDARQVLRLQAQYAMDKKALENEHELRKKERDRQHEEDLRRIRDERDERLRELEEEERIKRQRAEEDFALEQKRKAEDHARDMEQLTNEINDRLMEFARAIGEEYGLNEEGVNALYNLLQQYYGPGGAIPNLYDYSYEYIVSRAQEMLALVNSMVAQAQAALGSIGGMRPRFDDEIVLPPQASGGAYFANRPTKTTFGEAGPELALFLPLNGNMTGKMPAGISPAAGKDGKMDLNVWLSPDLEARIVNEAEARVANVFVHVNRSKE